MYEPIEKLDQKYSLLIDISSIHRCVVSVKGVSLEEEFFPVSLHSSRCHTRPPAPVTSAQLLGTALANC